MPVIVHAALMALALAIVAAFWAVFVLHGPVDGRRLAESLQRSGPDVAWACEGGRGGVWRCPVWVDVGSGVTTWTVHVEDGSSCWRARDRRGCVHLIEPTFMLDPFALSGGD
ncbi:MAG TPA: hypothetical protein VNT55_19590 [Baekduia sp.]|nr:hypothetical protein [Baekduia sp.]